MERSNFGIKSYISNTKLSIRTILGTLQGRALIIDELDCPLHLIVEHMRECG